MNKRRFSFLKSPVFAGLFLFIILSACQSPKSIDEVTLAFWQAIANNDLATAKTYSSKDSQSLFDSSIENPLKNASFTVGEIVINDTQARAETQAILPNSNKITFSTFLVKEGQHWRVDYQQSQYSLSDDMFNGLFKSLQNIGDHLNKQLEQQIPRIEKEVDAIGQKLKKQLDKLGQDLEKALPPPQKKQDPYQDSI